MLNSVVGVKSFSLEDTVFYTVWLNSKTFKATPFFDLRKNFNPCCFLDPGNLFDPCQNFNSSHLFKTNPKLSWDHATFWPTLTMPTTSKFYGPTPKIDLRHSRTHSPLLPTPPLNSHYMSPTLFSRVSKDVVRTLVNI